ncbi:hypothetical protein [Sphaerimonospora mesophila]|uniref:hypothetical protein n=1 Tax=Sphaerimonospora mesophila TaxID=37483 RepID=UPI0006E3FED1
MKPEEAAENLANIRRTQAKAVTQRWFPAWYLGGIGLFLTGLQFITEPGIPNLVRVGVGISIFLGLGALIAVLARTRRMTAGSGLAWPAFLPVFLPWFSVGIGLMLGLMFLFNTMGMTYWRTFGSLAFAVYLALGSPLISRWSSRRMARKLEEER